MDSSSFDIMFKVIPIVLPIGVIIIFAAAFLNIFSPKFRGKMMSKQIKAAKHMMEESADDLKDITDSMAYATNGAFRKTARAVKEGFTGTSIYCKNCGASIDSNSRFCNKCGKEQ